MFHFVRRTIGPVATALTVAMVAIVSAECVSDAQMSAAEKLCCAGMGDMCGASVEQTCCSTQSPQIAQSVAIRPVSVSAPSVRLATAIAVRDSNTLKALFLPSHPQASKPPG